MAWKGAGGWVIFRSSLPNSARSIGPFDRREKRPADHDPVKVHATDTTDEHTESGRAYPLYNWEETHFDVTCDAPGCGEVILEQNCTDDCEVQP